MTKDWKYQYNRSVINCRGKYSEFIADVGGVWVQSSVFPRKTVRQYIDMLSKERNVAIANIYVKSASNSQSSPFDPHL